MRQGMPVQATVNAQAKVNLFLRVLAREDDGYHQVETLLCRLRLSDTVTVRLTTSARTFDCGGAGFTAESLGPADRNVAWRAALAHAEATRFGGGFAVEVEKRIPVGGGLGGGSADAGAVLRAMNALSPTPLPERDLLALAASVGADVPFLTQERSPLALGWGRGERLLVLPPLPASAAWLLVPAQGVSTADAYRWVDEATRSHIAVAHGVDQFSSWRAVSAMATNDFEAVVGSRVPIIAGLLSALRDGPTREVLGESAVVVLSGSGSTVAVIAGERPASDLGPPPTVNGVTVLETETATFVEPVVLTH